jgi:hypothetical protein
MRDIRKRDIWKKRAGDKERQVRPFVLTNLKAEILPSSQRRRRRKRRARLPFKGGSLAQMFRSLLKAGSRG